MFKTIERRLQCQQHEKMDVIHFYTNTDFFKGPDAGLSPYHNAELDHLKFHRERGD